MKEIQYKVITSISNPMCFGHVALTTFTEAVQNLKLAYMTAYFKADLRKKHQKAQQLGMTLKKYMEYSYVYS